VVGPLVLIFIGGVFLLQNAGYLPPNFWVNLWRLWPLVLVLAGIELLLAHRVPWLVLSGLAACVAPPRSVCDARVTAGAVGPVDKLEPLANAPNTRTMAATTTNASHGTRWARSSSIPASTNTSGHRRHRFIQKLGGR